MKRPMPNVPSEKARREVALGWGLPSSLFEDSIGREGGIGETKVSSKFLAKTGSGFPRG